MGKTLTYCPIVGFTTSYKYFVTTRPEVFETVHSVIRFIVTVSLV